MRKRSRRSIDIFNQPHVIERLAVDLTGLVKRLEAELFEIRGETTVLNRDLVGKQEQLAQSREKLARLKGDLSAVRGQYRTTRNEHDAQTIIEGQLSSAKQDLSEEMRRLLGECLATGPEKGHRGAEYLPAREGDTGDE